MKIQNNFALITIIKVVAEFGPIAIKQPKEVIEGMSDWCKQTFAKNGLTERIKKSVTGERDTENMVGLMGLPAELLH